MAPIASVAISTWKRCALLVEQIVSLENQTLARDLYEINVYDSDSPDGTRAAVEELGRIYGNVHYVNVNVNAPAHKRNVAIRETQSPVLIMMDDDLLASPQLVETHVRAQENATGTVFCGQVRFPTRLIDSSNYFRFRDSRHLGPDRPHLDPANLPFQYVVVMNMSAKPAELRAQVGGFAEEFVGGYACEDYEYGYRIVKGGLRLVYLADALAIHREASHGVAVFYNKMRSMARDSVPVLKRLVPPEELAGATFYLEPVADVDPMAVRVKKNIARGLMNRYAAKAALRYLEATDSIPWLYAPMMYQYLLAYAYYEGTSQRKPETSGSQMLTPQAGGAP